MAIPQTVLDRLKLTIDLAFGALAEGSKQVILKGPSSAPAADRNYTVPDVLADADFVMTAGAQTITGVKTFSGANVITFANTGLKIQDSDASHVVTISPGNESANRSLAIPVLGGNDTVMTLGTAQTVTGAKTFSSPIAGASINTSVRRQSLSIPVNGGALMADGTVYEAVLPMRRAGTVKALDIAAVIRAAGGTSTIVVFKRNGGTEVTLLSTANVDPNSVPAAAYTTEALVLTAVSADLSFVAGDVLGVRITCGTMTTDGKGYSVGFDLEFTDV